MADKSSFVLYTRYREQINMLNNEQAGQLMKAIFDYQAMGEVTIEEPVVAMLWSVMKQQLDVDNQKYQETCAKRAAAGAKGGKSKHSKSENEEAKQANAIFAKQTKAKQADNDNDIEYENEIDNENDMSSSSDDYEDINNDSACACGRHRDSSSQIIPFGKDGYPTTQAEVRKVEALAEHLCTEYRQKPPNKNDVQKVFGYVYARVELPNGESIAAFDQQKAALLEYAFEQAAAADKVNWRYIDGIYRNWNGNGIDSLQKLDEHEFQRQHGISQEEFLQKLYGG